MPHQPNMTVDSGVQVSSEAHEGIHAPPVHHDSGGRCAGTLRSRRGHQCSTSITRWRSQVCRHPQKQMRASMLDQPNVIVDSGVQALSEADEEMKAHSIRLMPGMGYR